MKRVSVLLFIPALLHFNPMNAQTNQWLKDLLLSKAPPLLKRVLNNPDSFQYQIIYTQINRDGSNDPYFSNYFVNVDRNRYFNPASTVKLPVVLASLEKLNTVVLNGITKYSFMLTDSSYTGETTALKDSTSANGYPSIAHYIKKIFLVSDNDAYNRLYEFVGQERLNKTLWEKGYKDIRITRRFTPMTEEENRHTNSIRFMNKNKLVYQQPSENSALQFDFSKRIQFGKGHWNEKDSLINEPMDFTRHNNLPLEDLQKLLQSALFPLSVPEKMRFALTKDDERLLLYYMSAYPSESDYPKYDTTYFDSYAKFFFKHKRQSIPPYMRLFNKPGWSFGFLTDAAYVVDFKNNIEFMLSATIYVNSDGILNDNKYEYEEIGYPFFNELFNIIYEFELNRKRAYLPNLQHFNLKYNKK
ncbi:MAG TPA: serine hydrolase [Flavisolibacter sp.]|nr:serine hydrolase [Flavisolibacter sp.]